MAAIPTFLTSCTNFLTDSLIDLIHTLNELLKINLVVSILVNLLDYRLDVVFGQSSALKFSHEDFLDLFKWNAAVVVSVK